MRPRFNARTHFFIAAARKTVQRGGLLSVFARSCRFSSFSIPDSLVLPIFCPYFFQLLSFRFLFCFISVLCLSADFQSSENNINYG